MQHLKHVILATLLLSGAFTNLFAQSVWTKQVSGTTNGLTSVIWTGSQLVAVGFGGTILTSTDGVNWTSRTSGTTNALISVCWMGNQLVTVGYAGTILTSTNGVNWTIRASGTTNDLNSVTWTGTQLVAVGAFGTILTSPDGVTWTVRTSGTTQPMYAVTWTGSQLVAGGVVSTLITSPDGVTWTPRNLGITRTIQGLTWTGSQMVAAGSGGAIFTSPDGITWTLRSTGVSSTLFSVAWIGGQLIAIGANNGAILISPDGVTWAVKSSGQSLILTSAAWTGSRFVVVGNSGTILTSFPDLAPTSPTLISPIQNATGITIAPTLMWNASSGALTYHIQLSTDSTFKTALLNDSAITDTSKPAGTLANLTTYYWRVNAKNTAGTSAYSTVRRFTTGTLPALPSVPVLNSPVQNSTGIPVSTTLTWATSSAADSYRVQVSRDSTFATTILNDSAVTSNSRVTGTLANNTVYYWRVNAKNTAGTSAYSTIWHFTTIPALPSFPVLSTPTQNATGISTSPNLTWVSSSGATSYRLQVSTNSGFTTTVVNDSTITTNTRAIGPLTINTVYYWRVNAKNAAGTSAYSAIWNFTTSTVGIFPKQIEIQPLDIENGRALRFDLPQRTHVIIQLFNSQGRMIAQLLDETRNAGNYTVPLTNDPQGSYYLDFRAGDFHKTLKVR